MSNSQAKVGPQVLSSHIHGLSSIFFLVIYIFFQNMFSAIISTVANPINFTERNFREISTARIDVKHTTGSLGIARVLCFPFYFYPLRSFQLFAEGPFSCKTLNQARRSPFPLSVNRQQNK